MIPADTGGWGGHPRGLSTLFFIEMWERFSYYGMRAFLILYMVAPVAAGGLGFSDKDAASIYGTYTGSVWGMRSSAASSPIVFSASTTPCSSAVRSSRSGTSRLRSRRCPPFTPA
jgi:hypothetical protein